MKYGLSAFVLFIIVLQILFIVPQAGSEDTEVEWMEQISVSGSCNTENIHRQIQVNSRAVEIIVTLTWEVNGTGANLDARGYEGEGVSHSWKVDICHNSHLLRVQRGGSLYSQHHHAQYCASQD